MKKSYLQLAAWAALALSVPLAAYPAERSDSTGGTYVDSSGKAHSWSINEAHTLIWDSEPYIPVGGMFCAKYLTLGQTEENWNADVAALKTLKDKGILDIYINPGIPATSIPKAAWQRLVDHLESMGFRYGIELTDGPRKPLVGWIIKPSLYRAPDITQDRTFDLNIPSLTGGLWAVADAKSGDMLKISSLKVADGKTSVDVLVPSDSKRVLLLYPIKRVNSQTDGLQNFWEGYSEYRDRLIAHFRGLKLGQGFRFWVDPFTNEMGVRGESENLIPSSKAWQVELEAWLRKKYSGIGALSQAWALPSDVKTFEQASQLIPLWYEYKGVMQVYNSASGDTYKIPRASGIWADITDFRNQSIQRYLNQISAVLKREIANVPVVVKCMSPHPFMINSEPGGFDGIGVEAYAPPATLGATAADIGLALAEQWSRKVWLLATETQTTASNTKPEGGYASEQEMIASLNALKDAGCKGFYVFGLQLLPEPIWNNFELLRTPEQLDWLKGFQDKLAVETLLAEWRPRTIWYSATNPAGAQTSRPEKDLWWLPKQGVAEEVSILPGVQAYEITDASGPAMYIWTTGPDRTLEVDVESGMRPAVFFTGGEARAVKTSKRTLIIPLNRDPAIVRGLAKTSFLSKEGLITKVEYLSKLVDRAAALPGGAASYKQMLETVKFNIKADRLGTAATTLSVAVAELEAQVAPFCWVEGEDASETSFGGTAYATGASRGRYLRLVAEADPPLAPYSASFPVYASSEADYEIWVAGTPPGQAWVSPVSWNVDDSGWNPAAGSPVTGTAYAPDMYWTKLTTTHLAAGKHVLRIRVDGRRKLPDTNYLMHIDAVVIAHPGAFKPNGVQRPELN